MQTLLVCCVWLEAKAVSFRGARVEPHFDGGCFPILTS